MNTVGARFLAAAVLAAVLSGCNDNGSIGLLRNSNGECLIAQTLLGGVWHLDLGAASTSVLAECQDASLNGVPVRVLNPTVPCASILPCPPFGTVFDARILFVVDQGDGALIAIQGTGYQPGDLMNAEIRTADCLTSFDFQQAEANDPLTMEIRCGGDFDERTAKMSADCQSVYVVSGGTTSICAIDPPFHPVVTLQPDAVLFPVAAGS